MSNINKLTWIVETIRRHGRITFEDLNNLWMRNVEVSDGIPMSKRTFHKWRQNIIDTFGLYIDCDNSGNYNYYISNVEDMKGNSMEMWLLNTFNVCNSLIENRGMKERIMLEDVPSGALYLNPIIIAMRSNKCVEIVYHNYVRNDHIAHIVDPYFVKLFKRRWYVIAKPHDGDYPHVYSLDRIDNLKLLEETFAYPQDFMPEEFFRYNFGIYKSDRKPERVVVKASAWQACYMRALPVMKETQCEIETNEDYSIFTFVIAPTYDFKQELLRMGDTIEVLEPKWLRKEMKELIGNMKKIYGR